jgi:very-short-patch-repair endonuclease
MTGIEEKRDVLLALLRGAQGAIPISDLWRGLQNRGVDVGYNELEDWLLDQTDLVRTSTDGGVTLRPSVDVTHLRRMRIVPDAYEETSDVDATTRFHRLIGYYRDCLREEGKAIYAYRGQQNASFVTLDQELYSGGRDFASVRIADAGDFARNTTGGQRAAFYGYPLLLSWIETGDGEFADYKVIPVFITRLEMQEEPERRIFHLASRSIRLNPLLMKNARWKDRPFVGTTLDADADSYSSFEERLAMLSSVFQDEPVREELDPSAVFRAKNFSLLEERKGGFYNQCGIFLGGANPYIHGLIRDMELLEEQATSHFEQTAIAPLLRSVTENAEVIHAQSEVIRVLSPGAEGEVLNAPQETAVRNAFEQPLSVVTGPPGTGKSQVVSAIITSAVLHGQTVLFASRNNKALEVVQERLKKACPDKHALMRVGGEYDQDCREVLARMSNLPAREDIMPFHRQMESIDLHLADLDKLQQTLDKKARALGEAALAEERFEFQKKKFLPGRPDAYDLVTAFSSDKLLTFAKRLERVLERTATWPAFLANLLIRLQSRAGRIGLEALDAELRKAHIEAEPIWPRDRVQLRETFRSLFPLVDLIRSAADLRVASAELGQAGALDDLYVKITEHRTAIARKVPDLLLAKVKENASGQGMPPETDEALNQYRETVPRLRGTRLNHEQRRIRLEGLGRVFPDMLRRLPAWAVTNLSVSHRIPLEAGVFDIVVIDEASQCDIPSCLPLLYRAKRAVIIGDPLQLSQITNISPSVEDQLLRQYKLDGPENDHLRYSDKSMYDAGGRVTFREGCQFLSSHYRCHPDIISFANSAHWYEDRLEVFTDVESLKRPEFWERGIEWVQVDSDVRATGKGEYCLNEEVDKTVSLVREILEERGYAGTVGVVTPLRLMADRIRDGVDKCVRPNLLQAANFESQTAHGFQGDERDIIVYAMAVHPEMPRGSRWFVAENRNLFNVALSRARAAFVVVGDKEAVRGFTFENRPVEYLRDFVAYVDSLGKEKAQPSGEPIFKPEQLWEERFYLQALKPANLPVRSQYPLGPYKLDFALLRQDKGRKLDIEVDGETYHKDNAGKRLRKDIERDIYVKSQDGGKWDVMRFWVYELREDMESCVKKIQQWMNSAP